MASLWQLWTLGAVLLIQVGCIVGQKFPSGGGGGLTKPQGGFTQPKLTRPQGGFTQPQFTRPQGGFSQPQFTRPQGGFTRPQGGFTRPQGGFTRPQGGLTRPQGGFTRPQGLTMPQQRFTMPPQVKATYTCPRECQSCQFFKDKSKVCMAFDDFGEIKTKAYNALSNKAQDDFDFMKNSTLFKTTAFGATCDGLKIYLESWAKLGRAGKDSLVRFIEDPRRLTPTQLENLVKITIVHFAIIEERVERNLYSKMNDGQKLVLCKALAGTDCFTRVAISKRLDCGRIILKSGAASAKDISSLIDQNNCTSWDKEQWNLTMKYSPEVLKMECLKIAPPDVMVENMDTLSEHCHKLGKREIKILANITIDKFKNDKKLGNSLSNGDKDALAEFLSKCGADPSMMGDLISKSEMLSKVDYSKTDAKSGIKFMKEVLQTVQPKDLTKDQIVNSFKMMVFNRSLLNELDQTELESAVCEICDKADDYEEADLAKLTKVVLDRVPSLRDPSNYDQATIDCIGPLMKFLPMQSFDQIPANVLGSAFSGGKMKNMTITSRAMAKKVFEAAKSASGKTFDQFSKADVENLGSAVVALEAKDLSKIPDSVFGDDIIDMFATNIKKSRDTDNKPSKAILSALMEKVKNSAGGVKKAIESGLGGDIPTDLLKNADLSDLPDITGDSAEVTIEVDNKRAGILMKKLKEKLGDLDAADTNFTIQRLQNIEKIACGLTPVDIKNISRDNECVDKMNAITNSPCIRKDQVKAALESYKEATSFDSSTENEIESSTDSSTLSQTTPELMAQFTYAEMKKFGTSHKDAVVSAVAGADKEVMDKNNMKDGFKFVMEAKGKSTTGDITKDDLDETGNVVCGIDSSSISRLDSEALEEYASDIEKCPLGATERKALASNVMNKLDLNDGSKVDATSVLTLGTSIGEMSDSQLDAIDKEVLCDMSDKVAKAFKDKEDEETKRKKKGFKMDTTDSDEASYKANKKRVMKKLLQSQDACESSSSSSSSGRRKRSTTSLTCSYMRNIGTSGLSALTLDQINNLDDTEFTDCVDILGAVTDYSTDQKEALANVGKRSTVWGAASTWDAATVFSAGVIVQGLTVSEIETVTLDLDAISKLGEFDGWTDAQKKALFDRWLTSEKSSDASTITSSELRSLGHMTCGATTGHIASIPHSVYSSAADAVGEVTSCEEGQLTSFMTLAKSAYGSDVTTWDSTTVSNIGTVIGGMDQNDIPLLSESQIDAIDSNHVSYIPASTFAAFTTSQINTMSVSQAQSTTTDQRSALDSTQMAALTSVANTTFSDTQSGCDMTQISWLVTLLMALIAAYFQRH